MDISPTQEMNTESVHRHAPVGANFYVQQDDSGHLAYFESIDDDLNNEEQSGYAVGGSNIQSEISSSEDGIGTVLPDRSTAATETQEHDDDDEEDAVFQTTASASALQLMRHQWTPSRFSRAHSAPTLLESEAGLTLRNIGDDFNYSRRVANGMRHSSHPVTTNHHSHGVLSGMLRRFSWNNLLRQSPQQHVSDNTDVSDAGLSRPNSSSSQQSGGRVSQRTSIQSVPEEDEDREK